MKPALILMLLLIIPAASAFDQVVVNSQDWRDVYAGITYGERNNIPVNFMTDLKSQLTFTQTLDRIRTDLLLIQSPSEVYAVAYGQVLADLGFQVTVLEEDNNPMEIMRLLSQEKGISSFIILDDSYGYNSISVAPYAAVANKGVLFANRNNIDDVRGLLDEYGNDVLIYGEVDREVKDALSGYDPEVLNLGSRFDNNIEMVRRYLKVKPTSQVFLTNGEFIERELLSGSYPILFIGKDNVPDQVIEFINEGYFSVGVLVGNDLLQTSLFIKDQTGLHTFVKFARSARIPSSPIEKIEGLDLQYMPRIMLSIDVASLRYNYLTKQLEMVVQNKADLVTYFRSTILVRSDGESIATLGDPVPVFVDKNEFKTITYPLETLGQNLTAEILFSYGEGSKSLEQAAQTSLPVERIEIQDDSDVGITGAVYAKNKGVLYVVVENRGGVDAYVDAEVIGLIVDGDPTTVSVRGTYLVQAHDSARLPISVTLTEADLIDNPTVSAQIYFGERENVLVKRSSAEVNLEISQVDYITIGLVTLSVLVVLLILLILIKRRKK